MHHSLVIGGTRGIGREVVRRFATDRHRVSVIGGHQPSPEDAQLPGVRHFVADLTGSSLDDVLPEILSAGKLRNLVFCQRYKGGGDRWEGEIRTSLTATRHLMERLATEFEGEGDKAIVPTSSVVSHLVAAEQDVAYHVAKAGLVQLSRFFAVRFGNRGIPRQLRFTQCLYPKDESREYYRENPALVELLSKITPLGRMGTASEIASVVHFLCSPEASFLTGQDLVVDGGSSLQAHPALARLLCGPIASP